MLVIKYAIGCLKEDMEAADMRIWKYSTTPGNFHPSPTHRLYTSRKEGEWGLVSKPLS